MREDELSKRLREAYAAKPKKKVTPAMLAWGILLQFVWFLFVMLAGGWLIAELWESIATDLMLPELSFSSGVAVALLVFVISRIVTYTRVKA